MPLAFIALGPIELIILAFSAVFWLAVIGFVVFVVRSLRGRADHDRTIATLVEENRRLRKAVGERLSREDEAQ